MKGDQKKVTDEGPQKPIMLRFVPVPLRLQDPLRPVRQVVQKQTLWHLPLYFRVSAQLTVVAGKMLFYYFLCILGNIGIESPSGGKRITI